MIYLVTGWPGAGKSTISVQHAINRYLSKGRRVAANFPIDVSRLSVRRRGPLADAVVEVLPDRPTRADLDRLGIGDPREREETAGLLIIDEAGGWLNARTWQGQEREQIIDWLTQSRKRYWDIILIAQAPNMLDKQVREAVCELVARLKRLDRMKLLGIAMPRMHIAVVKYGLDQNSVVTERWFYRGTDAHKCFASYRLFGADATHYSVLPPRLTKWRYIPERVMLPAGRALSIAGAVAFLLVLSRSSFIAAYMAMMWFWAAALMWGTTSLLPAEQKAGKRLPRLRRAMAALRAPVGRDAPKPEVVPAGAAAPPVARTRGPQLKSPPSPIRAALGWPEIPDFIRGSVPASYSLAAYAQAAQRPGGAA